jgi:hypothetical protein
MARHPSTAIKPIAVATSPATFVAEVEAVKSYALAEKEDATRRAYPRDFEMFGAWCRARRNVEPLGQRRTRWRPTWRRRRRPK